MHDLKTLTALGGHEPRIDTFDHITITENDGLALASVSARLGFEAQCQAHIQDVLASVPGPGKAGSRGTATGFWMGPDQWMVGASKAENELLADDLKAKFKDTASITEQTGGWVCFDLTGPGIADVMERLCAVRVRKMQAGDAQRTLIHQLGCFVIRNDKGTLRILGPRASAGSLHHALITAAQATA